MWARVPATGQAQLWDFFRLIEDIAYNRYRLVNNAQLKGWLDAIFNVIITCNTNYTIDGKSLTATGMFLLYIFYQFNADCMSTGDFVPHGQPGEVGYPLNAVPQQTGANLPESNEWIENGWTWNWFGPTGVTCFAAPTTVPLFFDSCNTNAQLLHHDVVLKKGSTETVMLTTDIDLVNVDTFNKIQQFEYSRFDPANWKNSNVFVQTLQSSIVWQQQSATVSNLMQQSSLTPDAYFYLIFLLIGLGTSNANDQQLALRIVNAPVNSIEYPNDTFSNQLFYSALMYFADPLGDYSYDNAQLQSMLNDINSSIVSTNAASAVLKQSITRSLKILHVDSAYPTQDLYNPNTGFTTRQSDTLAALDAAREGLV